MQDYTFLDDYDYTECTQCHSHIQPYNNTSITTIMTETTTTDKTTTTTTIEIIRDSLKKSANSFTRTLLKYHHLHCEKCGLYIEIHPECDDEVSEKIFICSNTNNNNPHKYCLCYHCGLLYGINPNAKSIDIISILQTQIDNMHESNKELTLSSENQIDGEQQSKAKQDELNQHDDHDDHCEEEEHSLESIEVNDDNGDCSEDDSVDNQDRKENHNKIDESYMSLLALKGKLSNIQSSNTHNKTVSCPSSPNTSFKFSISSNLPQSLRGSPLLGPSTPSPRVLGRDVDEIWEKYKLQKKEEKLVNKSNVKDKLQEQQSQIDNLQELLKQIQDRKKQAIQGVKMFAGKPYSRGLRKNDI